MTPLVTRYPLDPTGKSPNNLVVGEKHTMVRRKIRAIATQYGAFFTESLKVVDTVTNQPLVKGTQYYATELYELPSARYGKEICAIIIINDPTVGDEVTLQYQALGGEFSNSMTAIVQQIEKLNLDERPVAWGNIMGKPDEFPPSHHLHDIGDIYGFEYMVHAIDRVRAAILMGDDISHDVIYRYIDMADAEIIALLNQERNKLDAHISDKNNPHNVTPEQLNVYIKQEVNTLLTNLDTKLTNALNAHVNNKNNPHNVTPTQLNVYTKPETDTLLAQAAATAAANLKAHTDRKDNPHGVTAEQLNVYVKTAVDTLLANLDTKLTNAINAHATRTDNPHSTTAAQVGSYTQAQIDAKDTTVATNAQNALNAFAARRDNPHQVTAAQVGAYTQVETAQMITSARQDAANALSSHTNNTSNPHATTKAQVGLGSVENLPIATQAQAEVLGTSAINTAYMTPLRVNNRFALHTASGDHDGRYIPANSGIEGSIHAPGNGVAYVWISGGWRAFWPPQWQ